MSLKLSPERRGLPPDTTDKQVKGYPNKNQPLAKKKILQDYLREELHSGDRKRSRKAMRQIDILTHQKID